MPISTEREVTKVCHGCFNQFLVRQEPSMNDEEFDKTEKLVCVLYCPYCACTSLLDLETGEEDERNSKK